MVSISAESVSTADLHSEYGEVGLKVPNSKYFRDYCGLCGTVIRVPKDRVGKFNSCSFCEPAYRGVPSVPLYEREWLQELLNQA